MEASRRTFLKTAGVISFGGMLSTARSKPLMELEHMDTVMDIRPNGGKYELPPLGYEFGALEPFIDAKTMDLHYTKHHATYVAKLNEAMEKEPTLTRHSLEELLKTSKTLPESVRNAVRNHGGGHWNHTFFWKLLKKGTTPGRKISGIINNSFGSMDTFKKQFEGAANGLFGSGWVWAVINMGSLTIVTTPNQDNPTMDVAEGKGKPIIGLDVWEHAYYLKHQNKRADYVSGFWNVLNWEQAEANMSL